MKKKLLLSLALLASVTLASAQKINLQTRNLVKKSNKTSQVENGLSPIKAMPNNKLLLGTPEMKEKQFASPFSSKAMKAPRKADAEDTKSIFSFPTAQRLYLFGFSDWTAFAGQTTYNYWSDIPAKYAQATVDSVYVIFYDVPKIEGNVIIYFYNANDATGDTYKEYEISTSELNDTTSDGYLQYSYIGLSETYTVPTGGCRVGYYFEAAEDATPIVTFNNYSTAGYVDGSFYFSYENNGSRYYEDLNSYGYGSLTTALLVDTKNCPTSTASIGSIGEFTTLAGSATSIMANVTNESLDSIHSISYIKTIDGTAQAEATYTFDEPVAGGSYATADFGSDTFAEGTHTVSVEITKVDGETNLSTDKVADDGYIIALEKGATRNNVIEEFTSTSCGWCPKGAVALDSLSKLGYITLANHIDYAYTDPMTVADNEEFVYSFASSFPSAAFNRYYVTDPYFSLGDYSYGFSAPYVVQALDKAYPAEATVNLTADWADNDGTQIKVNTAYTFGYDRDDANYAIAYILSEDGMVGNDSTWMQFNYFSYSDSYISYFSQFPGLSAWTSATRYVTTSYDHVVVGVWGSLNGLSNSVDALISKDIENTDTRTLDISSNTLIQNKSKLKLTALLLNNNNYAIANAAQVTLSAPAGINGVKANSNNDLTEVARYNANGQRIAAPQKGLNIVKMANGKSVKVLVK